MLETDNKQAYVLALDNGTQSIRALLFDLHGNIVAKSKINIEAYFSKEPGWSEQEPDYYWQMLSKACNELWPKLVQLKIDKSQIRAVSLTCQRATMINLDVNGKPLRPAFVWLDQSEQTDLVKYL